MKQKLSTMVGLCLGVVLVLVNFIVDRSLVYNIFTSQFAISSIVIIVASLLASLLAFFLWDIMFVKSKNVAMKILFGLLLIIICSLLIFVWFGVNLGLGFIGFW